MQFIDEAKIYIRSGDGGAGCTSFRREAHVPKGGPDGGNGGRGGDIIIEGVAGLNTLIDFRYEQHFRASKGEHGKGSDRNGSAGKDITIKVPVGTQVLLDDGQTMIMDVTKVGQQLVVAKGGKGGLGNACFKSSTNRAPRKSTEGWPGEESWLWLKLKLLSDAGLVGLPNAGKSTFLSKVSRAKPKIADYPFTTLKPQLGVVYTEQKEFVMADIPGLIEGAHKGQGLGDRFLKHIERCGVILHLVDGTEEDVVENYHIIRNELEKYSQTLSNKDEVLALNKCDALSEEESKRKRKVLEEASGKEVLVLSTVTGNGLNAVLHEVMNCVQNFRNEISLSQAQGS